MKQAIVSVLFERKAGAENSFIDQLNLLNLPNIYTTDGLQDSPIDLDALFYPFQDEFEEIWSLPTPTSYYKYEGSLSQPPCDEHVTYFIMHPPQKIGLTNLQLIKEVLEIPEVEALSGPNAGRRVIDMNKLYSSAPDGNNRSTQDDYNREVFFFDVEQAYPDFEFPKKEKAPDGHYERVERKVNEFLYVKGDRPSGIPGAILVPAAEAMGV